MGGGRRAVEIVSSKGCTSMLTEAASSFRKNNVDILQHCPDSDPELVGPFSGLVICITGLSKETRKQVKDATEKLGGVYSPNLHAQCTHLVLQSSSGLKLDDQAIKRASSGNGGLSLVTIGWFVDSVRRGVRLSEDLYGINRTARSIGKFTSYTGSENSCISTNSNGNASHVGGLEEWSRKKTSDSVLAGKSIYIDPDISPVEQTKVFEAGSREGVTFMKKRGSGSAADYVVCDGTSVRKYLGKCQSSNLVTSAWIIKTAKEGKVQRLVHISDDLAEQVQAMLKGSQKDNSKENIKNAECGSENKPNLDRHGDRHGSRLQTSSAIVLRETRSKLLDSICWNVSDPTANASIYVDSFGNDLSGNKASIFVDGNGDAKLETSVSSFSRQLNASEKSELILKAHILTILFPVDRYSEMGPSSRSFFSDKGFTCQQVLDHIYNFYQENLTDEETEIASHTESREADLLRILYSRNEAGMHGSVTFKRIDFLGNRKNFEMLKQATGNTYSTVYDRS